MITCSKCGEKIHVSTFIIEECPVCGSRLNNTLQQKESIEKTYINNLKKEINSELYNELISSFDVQKKNSSELKHFDVDLVESHHSNVSMKKDIKPDKEMHMSSRQNSVNKYNNINKTFEKTIPISGLDFLKTIDRVVNLTLLNHINIDISKVEWPETYYCDTLEDYVDVITRNLEISNTSREFILSYYKQQEEEAKKERVPSDYSSVYGMNLPGIGFFINGHCFSYIFGIDSFHSIKENDEAYAAFLETVAHEKLGHGFIDLFTAYGKDIQKIKITNRLLSELFYYKKFDTPEGELSHEKWEILYHSTKFTQEGYASWIERYALLEMKKKSEFKYIPFKRIDLNTISSILKIPHKFETTNEFIENISVFDEISNGLEKIFKEDVEFDKSIIPQTIRLLNDYGEDIDKLIRAEHPSWQGHAYEFGYLLMKKIEKKFGLFCVPLAVQIACNVKYGIDSISNTDLYRMVYEKPHLNIDTRLAKLSCLPEPEEISKNNIEYFSKQTRELLNFALP
jgi:hypothetical protein